MCKPSNKIKIHPELAAMVVAVDKLLEEGLTLKEAIDIYLRTI